VPRHRITTSTLLDDIERQRARAAARRWDELNREYMQADSRNGYGDAGLPPRARRDPLRTTQTGVTSTEG
jgi:hypothetical protein